MIENSHSVNQSDIRHHIDINGQDESTQQLETLREILIGSELVDTKVTIQDLKERIDDKQALVNTITPIMAASIRSGIRESQDEMIEALSPIVGKLVRKAVTDAMRDLVRNIDEQMRSTLDFQRTIRRLQARARGIPESELILRDALPFQIADIFLIHQEDGLLLHHASHKIDSDLASDSDLISGMLTAIQDFAQDVLGREEESQLDQIRYGERLILLEAANYTYIAVVIDGYEPSGIRSDIRTRLHEWEQRNRDFLKQYSGDASQLVQVDEHLLPLMQSNYVESKVITLNEQSLTPGPPDVSELDLYLIMLLVGIGILFVGWSLWQLL